MTEVEWQGVEQVKRRIEEYGRRAKEVTLSLANYWAAVLEADAKENAVWQDRTGNARQALHTFVEQAAGDAIVLYLSHGVNYGLFLEVRWAGRYAIIWPTIEKHLPEIRKMMHSIFA